MAVGLVGLVVVRFHTPWSERHPQVSQVVYVTDLNTRQAWRAAFTPGLDPWTRSVLTADGGTIERRASPPFVLRKGRVAPAKPVAFVAPPLSVTPQPDGTVAVVLSPTAASRALGLDIRTTAAVGDVRLNGQPARLLGKPGAWSHLRWVAGPIALSFRPSGPGRLEIRYGAFTESWPADAKPLPTRPRTVAPWDSGGSTAVIGSVSQAW